MKTRDVMRRLTEWGFTFVRHGGEHDIYACPCPDEHTVAVVRHRETSAGVVAGYARRAPRLKRRWWQ
jgi:predicted RNA binding protein YcfA (HicA-like mRNA interferase family)